MPLLKKLSSKKNKKKKTQPTKRTNHAQLKNQKAK